MSASGLRSCTEVVGSYLTATLWRHWTKAVGLRIDSVERLQKNIGCLGMGECS
jgi:hypothetical protein